MTILYLPSTAASAVALNMDELQYGAHLTLELKKANPTAVCVPATMRWDHLVNREAEWVVAVRITGADLSIFAMCKTFGMLIPSNLLRNGHSLFLGVSSNRCSRISETFYLPTAFGMGRSMLISSSHITPPPEQFDRTVVRCFRATDLCGRF